MMSEVQKRINKLKLSVKLLENHLQKFSHLIQLKQLHYIKHQINSYKRELGIRKDFPN